jgi:glycosyltransferase involved in cell wall biosynthesis
MGYGGAQRVIEALIRGSLSREYRFEILCLTHLGEIGERLREEGHRVFAAGLSGWKSPASWRRAADYAALLEPDLVHSHLLPGDVAAFVGFRRRAPWISTKHSTDMWMSQLARLAERFVLRGASEILAVSDTVARAKSYLAKRGILPIVVPNPAPVRIPLHPAPLFATGKPVRLGILGRLHPVKRVDLFLRMAARLESGFPSRFCFRIIGDGPERGALEHLASELGLDGRVEFRRTTDDVAEELDQLDLSFLFSEGEGLGLTILETLARGRIPVVRRAGGAQEALPPFLEGCFVDSSSPEAFADKALEICDRPDRFVPLIGQARQWLEQRPSCSDMTRRVYQEALGRSGSRKRVLHIITRLIVGGAQENTIASVERVDPARFESRLWTGPETGAEGSLLDDARRRGIVPRILPSLVREVHPWKDLLVTLQMARLLRRERFDIVHTHSSKAGIVGRLAAKIAGVSHITHTVHGWGFHDQMNSAVRKAYVLLERVMANWTRPLISVSDHTTRTGLDERIGHRSPYRLIRSGIPVGRFHPDPIRRSAMRRMLEISEGEIVIGSVGRLSPQKNPLDFIRAAAMLLERNEDLRFVYVGDGPLRSSVERAIREAGAKEKVALLGLRHDVPDLLRAMDLFLLTSLWEGLPRVIPQALATGLPVVAYDSGGVAEIVHEGRNGYLVRPSHVEELVEKVARLIEDDSLRSEMAGRAIHGFDGSFAEDTMIRGLEELYEEMSCSPRGFF